MADCFGREYRDHNRRLVLYSKLEVLLCAVTKGSHKEHLCKIYKIDFELQSNTLYKSDFSLYIPLTVCKRDNHFELPCVIN